MEAGQVRLRPILLTTITTMLGLMPLLFFVTGQAAFLKPLGISLAFGLLMATLLTLVVIPSIYLMVDRWRERHFGQWWKVPRWEEPVATPEGAPQNRRPEEGTAGGGA